MNNKDLKVPLMIGGTVFVATVAVGGLVLITEQNKPDDSNNDNVNNQKDNPQTESSYKDGKYYVEASYYVEAIDANETLGVIIEIDNGVVSNVRTLSIENGEIVDNEYLEKFEGEARNQIVGKELGEAFDFQVSGSSLTTEGFRDALNTIAVEAEE